MMKTMTVMALAAVEALAQDCLGWNNSVITEARNALIMGPFEETLEEKITRLTHISASTVYFSSSDCAYYPICHAHKALQNIDWGDREEGLLVMKDQQACKIQKESLVWRDYLPSCDDRDLFACYSPFTVFGLTFSGRYPLTNGACTVRLVVTDKSPFVQWSDVSKDYRVQEFDDELERLLLIDENDPALGGAEEKWIDLPMHQRLPEITEMIEDFDYDSESNMKLYVRVASIGAISDYEQVIDAWTVSTGIGEGE